jgi:5-formaminoimidazole-4-carboxamide-1-beta-D-ribofuranosyl 5'-monophosphate synthetase
MPGSPGTRFTPYPEYLHRRSISFGRRVAMEIKEAQKLGKIDDVTT